MSLNYTINLLTSIINWFALRTRVLTMIKNLYLISSIKFIGNSLQSAIQLKFTKKIEWKRLYNQMIRPRARNKRRRETITILYWIRNNIVITWKKDLITLNSINEEFSYS